MQHSFSTCHHASASTQTHPLLRNSWCTPFLLNPFRRSKPRSDIFPMVHADRYRRIWLFITPFSALDDTHWM